MYFAAIGEGVNIDLIFRPLDRNDGNRVCNHGGLRVSGIGDNRSPMNKIPVAKLE
jgi:hypothetical protein